MQPLPIRASIRLARIVSTLFCGVLCVTTIILGARSYYYADEGMFW